MTLGSDHGMEKASTRNEPKTQPGPAQIKENFKRAHLRSDRTQSSMNGVKIKAASDRNPIVGTSARSGLHPGRKGNHLDRRKHPTQRAQPGEPGRDGGCFIRRAALRMVLSLASPCCQVYAPVWSRWRRWMAGDRFLVVCLEGH